MGIGVLASLHTGCIAPGGALKEKRYERGLVLVLPGIEGASVWSRSMAVGLEDGSVGSAVELYDWTVGLPGSFLINLTALERNRRQARRVADRIIDYREKYPGNPVHIVAHSGGAGIAVLVLEALPAGRQIDSVVLLAPALSPEYELSTALRRVRRIYNFYSAHDVTLLKLGTTLFGGIDREFGPSAGAVGFSMTDNLDPEQKRLYKARLRQVAWGPALERAGASGTHMGWTSRKFARTYVAPLIRDAEAERMVTRGEPSE